MARWQINRLAVANSGQKYQIRPRRTLWAHGRRGFVWLEVGGWGITARFSGMALSEGIPRQEAAMHPRSIKAGSRLCTHVWTRLRRWAIRIVAGVALTMLLLPPHAD